MGKKKKTAPTPTPEVFANNPFAGLAGAALPARSETAAEKPLAAPPRSSSNPSTTTSWKTKIVVRRETKGRGGKTVTRITGLPEQELPEVALRMKRALGCGAVVEEGGLVLLGSLVERAADWLEAEGAERVIRGN